MKYKDFKRGCYIRISVKCSPDTSTIFCLDNGEGSDRQDLESLNVVTHVHRIKCNRWTQTGPPRLLTHQSTVRAKAALLPSGDFAR